MPAGRAPMIDAHAHLDDARFSEGEAGQALHRAAQAGVQAIILAAIDLDSARALLSLAGCHSEAPPVVLSPSAPLRINSAKNLEGAAGRLPAPDLYVAVGFHPHEASKLQPAGIEKLRALTHHPKVVAIGEIGLDYHYDHSPREVQRQAIQNQLTLARELDLPVVVHNREAEEDMYPILKASRARGILHCFSGTLEEAKRYVDLGFHLSIACTVTYPNAAPTREVVQHIPLDYLLTETDSPYLPPQSQRGKRNEPANVTAVVKKIAELKNLPEEEVAAQTAKNAAALFRLPRSVIASFDTRGYAPAGYWE